MARRGPGFRWTLTSRLLVNLANTLGVCYLLYFLTDQVHAADPVGALLPLTLIYVLGMLVTSVIGEFSRTGWAGAGSSCASP